MDTPPDNAAPASEAAEPSIDDAIAAAVEAAAAEPDDDPEEGGEPAPVAAAPVVADKPVEKPPAENDQVRAALRGAARREKSALDRERAASAALGKARAFDEFSRLLDTDPAAAFAALGKDPNKVYQATIDKGSPPAVTPESEIADLKRWRDEREAREAQQARDANLTAQRADVQRSITAAGDKFELINAQGEHGLVWDAMVAYYATHGTAPDPMDVAATVEEHLAEKAEKALATKRFATRVNAQPSNGKPHQPIPGETTIAGNRGTPVPVPEDDFPLDPREREEAVFRSLGIGRA